MGATMDAEGRATEGFKQGETCVSQPNADRYWARTSTLMWTMFVLWVIFSFVVHFFVDILNGIKILGFPLGFYMAAQGSLVAFLGILFYFAKRQDTIDREEGMAEDL
jgi:putative solute:sodium symporter small subunit